ncbi:excalibur calcium-binding domain-containing protein [Blastomonas sp.]|uniref:excalibur calcium-binding domain-containing protein n=1 Tax=Blastomonas sp. TaxID=1909299 RepID=UPI00406A9911
MSFKKPFKAVPIKLGSHYQRQARRAEQRRVVDLLTMAAFFGAAIGTGSLLLTDQDIAAFTTKMRPIAVGAGLMRAREPQPGDHWPGCNDARAAGTAPIYQGEPGYREGMDGDSDGIACEPYR